MSNDSSIELFYQEDSPTFYESYVIGRRRNGFHGNKHSQVVNVLVHNPRGPATVRVDNKRLRWFINGEHIEGNSTEDYCNKANMSDEDKFFFMITYGDKLPSKLDDVHPDHNPLLTMKPVYDYNME